uniref:Intraflagellar transport protein 56 n=1 Tax=Salmo trutta TaxID=8032 RepID=A0A673Z2R0_SALTR
MILSRVKPAAVGGEIPVNKKIKEKKSPLVEDFLIQRDYLGAITLLEVNRGEDADLWLAYCAFHLGDYKRAMEVSKPLLNSVTLVWMCESIFLKKYIFFRNVV